MNDMNEMIKFFFEKNITVHIDTSDGSWYNGLIVELHETMIVLNDRVEGLVPIHYSKIKNIDKFRGGRNK